MQYALIPASKSGGHSYFLAAFTLLNIFVLTLLLCSAGFLAGLPVFKWQFPLACALALIGHYFAAGFFGGGKRKRLFFQSGGLVLAVLIGSVLIAGSFYDVSFDGQWYHEETVMLLKQGYNPAHQKIPGRPYEDVGDASVGWCAGVDGPMPGQVSSGHPLDNTKSININNFSKGTEVIGAALYGVTGRIETAKAVNGMLLAATFFLCLAVLYKVDHIRTYKKWILAALVAFNPISLMQLNSFCVDGNLACTLVCLLAINLLLLVEMNRYYLVLLGSVIVLAVNIKFTNVVFTGVFCSLFLTILFVYKKRETFKQVLKVGVISGITGLLLCGYNPYVTNLIDKHDPFYGLSETRDVIRRMTPPIFQHLDRFGKLFFSLSAHQGWNSADKRSIWEIPKIPFSLNKEDIIDAKEPQQELSAFGPFFSGALLFAIPLFVLMLVRFRNSSSFQLLLAISLAILFTVFLMPDPWWGRFVPQLWLFPVVVTGMGALHPDRVGKILTVLLSLALGLNIAWAATGWVSNVSTSARIDYQMRQLRAIHQPVNIEFCPLRTYLSNEVRFQEWGIPITEKILTGPYVYNVVESNTRFETPVPLPDLPKPLLLRLAIKITGNDITSNPNH